MGQRRSLVLLDSNLLLVYLVHICDPDIFGRHKKVENYGRDDAELLLACIAYYSGIATTPHVLAEVSNLAASTGGDDRLRLLETLEFVIKDLKEHNVGVDELHKSKSVCRYGVADAAIERVARQPDILVLSDDLRFLHHLASRGVFGYNFNHIRQRFWFE